MKLVYTVAALVAAVTNASAFELSSKNVQALNAKLQAKLDAKYQSRSRSLRQKRSLFNSLLDTIAKEIDLSAYNEASAQCQVSTAGFWDDCRQCIAQQCTSYITQNCEPSKLTDAMSAADGRFKTLIESQQGEISPSITDMNEFLSILASNGINAEVDYNMAGADLKMSTDDVNRRRRRRRQAAQDDVVDCLQFVQSSENMEVKCVPAEMRDAEADDYEWQTNAAIFGNWQFDVQSTHEHEMLNEGTTADGATIIKLAIVPSAGAPSDADYESSEDGWLDGSPSFLSNDLKLVSQENEFQALDSVGQTIPISRNGESIICHDAVSCDKIGGNYVFDEENEFMPNKGAFDCNGAGDNANCDQMTMTYDMFDGGIAKNNQKRDDNVTQKDCDLEEGEISEEISPDYDDDVLRQDLSDEQFCDLIGGCPDVPFVRRSTRAERSAFAQQFCHDVETMPATCSALGLKCDTCNQKISAQCPDYHELRQELSAKIGEASALSEQYQSITSRHSNEVKFLHALRSAGSSALYVQSAKHNFSSNTVDLVIKVGSGSQADSVLVQSKVKADTTSEQFADKVASKMMDLI